MPTQKRRPIVVGNWKMNPKTIGLAKKLFLEIRNGLGRYKQQIGVVVAPPFPFISEMERLSPSKRIELAAQDIFYETHGAFTGEVSLPMLKSVGVSYAIIGHSERRALGETNEEIGRDVGAALRSSVTAIVCIGEKKRDSHGSHFNVVEEQCTAALASVPKTKAKSLIIAYEPVWAIGTGDTATAEDIEEMRLFIQKLIADRFGRKVADTIHILYGGSVNKKNAGDILEKTGVDGFLVGGASLRGKEFVEIIKITGEHANN